MELAKTTATASEISSGFTPEQIIVARKVLRLEPFEVFRKHVSVQHNERSQELINNADESESVAETERKIQAADEALLADSTKKYLDAANLEESDPVSAEVLRLLDKYSPLSVDGSSWIYGPLNSDGTYDTARSGKALFEAEVMNLFGEDEEYDQVGEVNRLQTELESARQNLAAVSIKRRTMVRKTGKKANELRRQYDIAQDAYNTALTQLGAGAVEQLRADGMSDAEVAQMVIMGTVHERRAFAEAEATAMEQDNSKMARLMRLYGKLPVMLGANTVAGVGIGMAARKLTKYGFIAAFPVAGIAGLAAVRAGKALLTTSATGRLRLARAHGKRSQKDIQSLTDLFESDTDRKVNVPEGADVDAEQYAQLSQKLIEQSIDQRVTKDINNNRWRAVASAVFAGGAALGGALLVDKAHGHFGGGGSKDAVTASKLSPETQAAINKDPEAFKRMVEHPEEFKRFMEGVRDIKAETGFAEGSPELSQRVHDTLALAQHMGGSHAAEAAHDSLRVLPVYEAAQTFSIPRGGGIIQDVIRPMAHADGHSLSSSQESQVWQAVKARFGNNLFVDLPVGAHGNDQWIMSSGQGTLRPEVAEYLKQQIKLAK